MSGALAIVFLLTLAASPVGEEGGAPHWLRPLAPQEGWRAEGLHPDNCGRCHVEQREGWGRSRHAMAVGPGLLAQLRPDGDPGFAASCLMCHGPLAEQAKRTGEEYGANPAYDETLLDTGVGCAACHLRGGVMYGPPRLSDKPLTVASDPGATPHGPFVPSPLFTEATFCAPCHQLDDGYVLNGKPLTNTYREWAQSPFGQDGVACQECHMPDRRHEWRGIHDPAMVRRALSTGVRRTAAGYRLTITNVGAGHHVPSYVTPLIVVQGYVRDSEGSPKPGSVRQAFIGRKVSLDLETEEYDTRIPAGGSFTFDYRPPHGMEGTVVIEITVHPDRFYADFFAATLAGGGGSMRRDHLHRAAKESARSSYLLERYVLKP